MARILIAGYCALPGPERAGVQLGHLLKAFRGDHAVDVLCIRRADQAYVERQGTARILRVPVSDGDAFARIETFRRALGRQLEGAEYDAIVVRDGSAGVPVLAMRDFLQAAIIFDAARSPLAEAPPLDMALAEQLAHDDGLCLREADLVLAPTEASRQYLSSRSRPERVHTVPLGVDVDLFDWDDPSPGPPRILCLGSLSAGRDVVTLLTAMRRVMSESDATLVLAGELAPEARVVVENDIASLGLQERVELIGAVEHRQVPKLIASATICVAPTAAELSTRPTTVFPSKILEYLAGRRPVVAPRTGTVTLLVRDRQHALLFSPDDHEALAQSLLRLLGDGELRDRLARAGYEMVRRDHTASATRRQLRRALDWLAMQPPWKERWGDALVRRVEPAKAPGVAAQAGVADSLAMAEHVRVPSGPGTPPGFHDEQTFTDGGRVAAEEVTMVETESGGDTGVSITTEARLEPGARSDDWVVEQGPGQEQSRFVAGEVEVADAPAVPRRAQRDTEPVFRAMGAMLGAPVAEGMPASDVAAETGAVVVPSGTKKKPPPVPGSLPKSRSTIARPKDGMLASPKKRPE